MCNCGTNRECIDTITDMFGCLIIPDDLTHNLDQFRGVCSHFDKFVTGHCDKGLSI